MQVLGVGDVHLKFQNYSSFMLKNVKHVPLITKILISTGVLDDVGYVIVFGNNVWKISKGSMTNEHCVKVSNLYMLHVSIVKHNTINVTK